MKTEQGKVLSRNHEPKLDRDRKRERQTDRQIERQTDRRTDRQRQRDRERHRHRDTDRQTDRRTKTGRERDHSVSPCPIPIKYYSLTADGRIIQIMTGGIKKAC